VIVMVGGYWSWFFIRVDASPLNALSPGEADLFVPVPARRRDARRNLGRHRLFGAGLTLLALHPSRPSCSFGGVPWSKFSHMFFKPAAALREADIKANGTAENHRCSRVTIPATKSTRWNCCRTLNGHNGARHQRKRQHY